MDICLVSLLLTEQRKTVVPERLDSAELGSTDTVVDSAALPWLQRTARVWGWRKGIRMTMTTSWHAGSVWGPFTCGGQRTTRGHHFSPSTCGSSGSVASILTWWATSCLMKMWSGLGLRCFYSYCSHWPFSHTAMLSYRGKLYSLLLEVFWGVWSTCVICRWRNIPR